MQKLRLERESLLEPLSSPGQRRVSAHLQPQSQQAREISHGDWQVSVEPLGCFLVGGVRYGANFERADAVEEGGTRRPAAFPGNAHGTRLVADRLASEHLSVYRGTDGSGSQSTLRWRGESRANSSLSQIPC